AFVHALADAGADVALNYHRSPEDAEQLARAVRERGRRAVTVQADMSDCNSIERMFDQVDEALGPVSLLVNNAGIDGERAMVWEISPEDWRQVIEVNLFGTFYCTR